MRGQPKGTRHENERDWLPDQVLRDTHARLLELLNGRRPKGRAVTHREFRHLFWLAYEESK